MPSLSANPAVLAGACLVPVSAWWFLQMLAGAAGGEASAAAATGQAVQALFLVRLGCVCLFAAAAGGPASRRAASRENLACLAIFVVAAWPFIAMLSLAGGPAVSSLLLAETAVVLAAIASLFLGGALRRLWRWRGAGDAAQVFAGVCIASLAWYLRRDLLLWTGLA